MGLSYEEWRTMQKTGSAAGAALPAANLPKASTYEEWRALQSGQPIAPAGSSLRVAPASAPTASLRAQNRDTFDSAVRKNYQSRTQAVAPLPTVETPSSGKSFIQKLGDILGFSQQMQQATDMQIYGNDKLKTMGQQLEDRAERNAVESAKEFGYIAEKGAAGAAKGVENIGNALGYMGQALSRTQNLQAAQDAAMWGAVTGSETQQAASKRFEDIAMRSVKQGLQDTTDFGQKYGEKVEDRYAGAQITGAGKKLGEVSEIIGGILPSAAANVIAPGSGIYMTMLNAGGGAAQEALASGANDAQALAYGAAVGVIEAATEKMFDGMAGIFGKGAADDVIDGVAKRLAKSAGAQNAVRKLADGLGEGFEEFVSELGGRLANELIVDTDNRSFLQTLGDAGYSFLMGALVSGVMQAAGSVVGGVKTNPRTLAQNAANAAVAQVRAQNPTGGVQADAGTENGQKNTASKIDAVNNTRLTNDDLSEYLKVGDRQHVRDSKMAQIRSGDSPILTTIGQIKSFIGNAVNGGFRNTIKAYGRVGTKMAADIASAANKKGVDGFENISGFYLELEANHLDHLSDHINDDGDPRNIPLTDEQTANLTEYIDTYDDVLDFVKKKDGSVKIYLGKRINGHAVIVEMLSKGRSSLHPVTAWQNTTDHYLKKYGKAKTQVDTSQPSTEAEGESGYKPTSANLTVPQAEQGVKNQYTQEVENYAAQPLSATETNASAQTTVSRADNLPTKAANYLKRAENAMLRTLGEKISVTNPVQNESLKTAVRQVSEEYLSTGQISKETENALFEQVWQQGEGGTERGQSDPDYKKWARNDFDDAMAKLRLELRQVNRYANDRADKLAREETTELTLEDVKVLYPQLKDARRAYEKVQARTLLTSEDDAMVSRLLRGDADLESLDPDKYNVAGIRAVYQAKQEYEDIAKQLRRWNQARKAQLKEKADIFLRTANAWKDKARGIFYSRETMERNIRDIVPDPILADQVIDEYFTPVHNAVAAANRTKNDYRDRVKALGLSRKVSKADAAQGRVSEAHAVQLLGEAQDSIRMLERSKGRMKERDGKTLEDWKAVVENLWANNPQLDKTKIEKAVVEFRKIYDELFAQMNNARVRNGYEPINYRSGYFPHFQPGDGDGVLVQFGKALGIDTAVSALPTSINGMSHTFKPGITWMGAAHERLGFNTVYDAVEGFDKYIEGCADVIHLTDSIQNLRAFASQIRYRTTDQGIRDQVDKIRADDRLTAQEKEDQINLIYNDPKTRYVLGNFVVELDEYINLLANKKSRADRNMEQALGRDAYNVVKALESRVAANMVAVNPASWLTNFIPLTQGWSGVSTKHMLEGMWGTLKNVKTNDGIVGQSSFLTNRKGSDPLVRTWAQSASAFASKPMEWIDTFVAGSLVRARYQENVGRGMSEDAAMQEADGWVAGVMADRSKGSTPTLFNRSNPITKLFTQFQLEVNNQLGYVFKDIPRDMKEKGVAALAGALLKFALGAFLFNEIYEYFVGRRPALDPIGMLNETVGDFTGYELPNLIEAGVAIANGKTPSFETEKTSASDAVKNALKRPVEQLPFVGALSPVAAQFGVELDQGRIPVASGLPDIGALGDAVGNSEWDTRKRLKEGLEEVAKPVLYLGMPFGGGQLKKLGQGIYAVAEGGSYNIDAEGNDVLQYPVSSDAASVFTATVFGKTATPDGREWIESGFKTLNAKETAVYKTMREAGVDEMDAFEILKEMKALEKKEDKLDVVINSGVPDDLMQEMAGLVMGTELKTESGNDSAWAKLLKAVNAGLDIEDAIQMRIDGVDFDRFLEIEAAGVDAKNARKLAESIGELKPAKGKSSVSNLQRYRAVVDTLTDAEDQIDALGTMMGESEFAKLKAANEYGVTPESYIDFKETLPKYDADSSGSYSQAETKAAIDAMGIRDNEWKAVLWQMANTGWKGKNNPYSQKIGQQIYDAMH